jgi:hypothetical protein
LVLVALLNYNLGLRSARKSLATIGLKEALENDSDRLTGIPNSTCDKYFTKAYVETSFVGMTANIKDGHSTSLLARE